MSCYYILPLAIEFKAVKEESVNVNSVISNPIIFDNPKEESHNIVFPIKMSRMLGFSLY